MFNPETNSQHEILVAQQNIKLPYDEELTEATLVLAAMQRHDVRAFEEALKFPFISESMTYIERYNKIYAYCKGWIHKRPVHHQAESDSYASSEAWQALWNSTKRRAAEYDRKSL